MIHKAGFLCSRFLTVSVKSNYWSIIMYPLRHIVVKYSYQSLQKVFLFSNCSADKLSHSNTINNEIEMNLQLRFFSACSVITEWKNFVANFEKKKNERKISVLLRARAWLLFLFLCFFNEQTVEKYLSAHILRALIHSWKSFINESQKSLFHFLIFTYS